jgi:hypothetical protein
MCPQTLFFPTDLFLCFDIIWFRKICEVKANITDLISWALLQDLKKKKNPLAVENVTGAVGGRNGFPG